MKQTLLGDTSEARVDKAWGYEQLLHNGDYCCKLLVYTQPGKASSLHFHDQKTETFVVTSGLFDIEIGDDPPCRCDRGWTVTLHPGTKHRIRCIRPGVIVEASTHDFPYDCVRLVPSDD